MVLIVGFARESKCIIFTPRGMKKGAHGSVGLTTIDTSHTLYSWLLIRSLNFYRKNLKGLGAFLKTLKY